jgi:hypothetical protein
VNKGNEIYPEPRTFKRTLLFVASLIVGFVFCIWVGYWTAFAAWMTAHPQADPVEWSRIFDVRFIALVVVCCLEFTQFVFFVIRAKRIEKTRGNFL